MILEVDSLTHSYDREQAITDVSFGLESGELVGLLGPSGCGKTTIVQAIAGHLSPTSGQIILRDRDVTADPPETRDVSIVFQQPTLYPHMTVRENIAYGLAARNIDSNKRGEIIEEHLDLVDLQDQQNAYPTELSGGQQRRVELARALAPQPDILLLDEPLSGLDPTLRTHLRREISRIQCETDVTTLFVTHNQDDAMALADRLMVMREGEIAGTGNPRDLYESPSSPYIASFLGRSNILSLTVVDTNPLTVTIGDNRVQIGEPTTGYDTGDTVSCHVRPKDLSVNCSDQDKTEQPPSVSGTVAEIVDLGRRYDVLFQTETGDKLTVEQTAKPPSVGESAIVTIPENCITVFDNSPEPTQN